MRADPVHAWAVAAAGPPVIVAGHLGLTGTAPGVAAVLGTVAAFVVTGGLLGRSLIAGSAIVAGQAALAALEALAQLGRTLAAAAPGLCLVTASSLVDLPARVTTVAAGTPRPGTWFRVPTRRGPPMTAIAQPC